MTAYLDHIAALNPLVNAVVDLRPRDELLAQAAAKDALLAAGTYQGWMHGFPHAVKDLADAAGFPTTMGFFRAPFAAAPAASDSLHVARIRAAGAIFVGKTNVPEFGLGSQTYNHVYGPTSNAYDQSRTSGGSSGGAAVAVALRMLPVADGSDFLGSLRNPPGWNNIFGLRPSFGRVPSDGADAFVAQGGVDGPIARTALDLALLLRTMSGYDPRAPLSIEQDPAHLTALERTDDESADRKVLWLGDLGGYLPMEPEILDVCRGALSQLESLGMQVSISDSLPTFGDFRGTSDLWPTWLAYRHWLAGTSLLPVHADPALRARMKPEALYEIAGLLDGVDGSGALTAAAVHRASLVRTAMYQAFRRLFDEYDFVLLPTAQVFPFDLSLHWPTSVNGIEMSSYHRWMEVTAISTLINAPTLAMPAGFGSGGLPIGLQAIGPNHSDFALLRLARAWERRTRWVERVRPALLSHLPDRAGPEPPTTVA